MNTTAKIADTEQTEDFKKAARDLSKFLEEQGVKLSHAVALEALSASLGLKNWRTLRSKLQAPAEPEEDISDGRYAVEATYLDNNQNYGDFVNAASPLAAAVYVLVERFTDSGWITEVGIDSVYDRKLRKSVMDFSFAADHALDDATVVIAKLCKMATGHATTDSDRQAIAFWEAVCGDKHKKGDLRVNYAAAQEVNEGLTDPDFMRGRKPGLSEFIDAAGASHEVSAVELLRTVLALASTGLDLAADVSWEAADQSGLLQVLQLTEILEQFDDRMNVLLAEHTVTAE